MSELRLKNCPYCKKEAVFEQGYIWNSKYTARCGCQTLGCRGNIKNSPDYGPSSDGDDNVTRMFNQWNRRENTD